MIKIGIVAGPGAGKTTLANALTARLKSMGRKWYNVPEYAREFIDEYGQDAVNRAAIVLLIANRQMRREKKVNVNADGFVTDSPLVLPWFYARGMDAEPTEYYMILSTLYKMFLKSMMDYDLVIFAKRENRYVDDGCRIQSEDEAKSIDVDLRHTMTAHGFKMLEVSGSTDERVDQIVARLYPDGGAGEVRKEVSPR